MGHPSTWAASVWDFHSTTGSGHIGPPVLGPLVQLLAVINLGHSFWAPFFTSFWDFRSTTGSSHIGPPVLAPVFNYNQWYTWATSFCTIHLTIGNGHFGPPCSTTSSNQPGPSVFGTLVQLLEAVTLSHHSWDPI